MITIHTLMIETRTALLRAKAEAGGRDGGRAAPPFVLLMDLEIKPHLRWFCL